MKCEKCNAEYTGENGIATVSGSTVAGTDAIEKVFDYYDAEAGLDDTLKKAHEQIYALTERIATLEQQIQQAERRGYELCTKHGYTPIDEWGDSTWRTYDEAIAAQKTEQERKQ